MMDRDSSGVPIVKVANRACAELSTPATPGFRRLRAEGVLGIQDLAGATKKFLSQSNSNDGHDRQERFGLYTTSLSQHAFS